MTSPSDDAVLPHDLAGEPVGIVEDVCRRVLGPAGARRADAGAVVVTVVVEAEALVVSVVRVSDALRAVLNLGRRDASSSQDLLGGLKAVRGAGVFVVEVLPGAESLASASLRCVLCGSHACSVARLR